MDLMDVEHRDTQAKDQGPNDDLDCLKYARVGGIGGQKTTDKSNYSDGV